MSMRIFLACLAASALLQGCIIFIPGSLINATSDAITGAEGEHCVGRGAKVGDRIRLPGGGFGTVKSLSGTSVRCSQSSTPIRAALVLDP